MHYGERKMGAVVRLGIGRKHGWQTSWDLVLADENIEFRMD